ncbi:30S ribosomal protein S9 [Candidatus Daviesbacteria bacterium]|nr:30S ribosomal protein S9 [Candidatus Daviesbacteria bacterium]
MADTQKSEKNNSKFTHAIGRRKEAVARVRIFKGVGQMIVNGKPISEYFKGVVFQKFYQKPFEVTGSLGQYTATVKVEGGGVISQLGAIVHGLARALDQINKETFHSPLKKAKLLTRDPRVKERRKYGLAHKARAKKQSPKR